MLSQACLLPPLMTQLANGNFLQLKLFHLKSTHNSHNTTQFKCSPQTTLSTPRNFNFSQRRWRVIFWIVQDESTRWPLCQIFHSEHSRLKESLLSLFHIRLHSSRNMFWGPDQTDPIWFLFPSLFSGRFPKYNWWQWDGNIYCVGALKQKRTEKQGGQSARVWKFRTSPKASKKSSKTKRMLKMCSLLKSTIVLLSSRLCSLSRWWVKFQCAKLYSSCRFNLNWFYLGSSPQGCA